MGGGVRRALRAAVPLLLLQAALVPGLAGAQDASSASPVATRVTVQACPAAARVVPLDYLGLSIEWSMVPHWFGTSGDGPVAATVELLRSLTGSPATTGVLRIGGSSQDGYRWAPDGTPEGNRLFFGRVTPGMVDALLSVARSAGWKVVLGLNLRDDQPGEAVALVRYAVQRDVGRTLLAVAPGNEPDGYLPRDEDYLERFGRYADALADDVLTRTVPLTGPDISNGADLGRITALRQAHGSRLAFVGWHDYANRPSLAKLLGEDVSTRFATRVAAAADAAGLTPARMSEGNSVGRGGLGRVSDVSGSTAWTVDTVLTGAAAGLAGFNLHAWDNHYYMEPGWKARYTPFFVREGAAFPAPGVYALALLREVPGRRFCTVQTAGVGGSAVKAWALTGAAERRMVAYLVNKRTDGGAARVTVALPPQMTGSVTVSRIRDAWGCGGRSTSINGAVLQRSGVLTWTPQPLARAADGTLSLPLDPCETAMLVAERDDDDVAVPPAPL